MSAKPKAILSITLRNNDRLWVSLVRQDGSGHTGYAKTWKEIERLLHEVKPTEERRRLADAHLQGDNHIANIKKALNPLKESAALCPEQHTPAESTSRCATQDRGTLSPSLPFADQVPIRQFLESLHRRGTYGTTMKIQIGTPLAPSVTEALQGCLSAILDLPRSLWTLVSALGRALILLSACRPKFRR